MLSLSRSLDWRSGLSHKSPYLEPHILGCLYPWTPWLCLKFFSSPGEGRGVQGPCSEPDKPYWRLLRRRTDETASFRRSQLKTQKNLALCQDMIFAKNAFFPKGSQPNYISIGVVPVLNLICIKYCFSHLSLSFSELASSLKKGKVLWGVIRMPPQMREVCFFSG